MIERYTRPEMGAIWTEEIALKLGLRLKFLPVKLGQN